MGDRQGRLSAVNGSEAVSVRRCGPYLWPTVHIAVRADTEVNQSISKIYTTPALVLRIKHRPTIVIRQCTTLRVVDGIDFTTCGALNVSQNLCSLTISHCPCVIYSYPCNKSYKTFPGFRILTFWPPCNVRAESFESERLHWKEDYDLRRWSLPTTKCP